MANINNYHTIDSLRERCQKMIPKVAFEYLQSGTEKERLLTLNESQFDKIKFIPKFCLGSKVASLKTTFLNQNFSSPIGIAPVGLTGLIWPKAEHFLATVADSKSIPFCLSTVATCSPEDLDKKQIFNPTTKWFQL